MATEREVAMQSDKEQSWKPRPFCADCIHFKRAGLFGRIEVCTHDAARNLITKELSISPYDMRSWEERCGMIARFFEPKREGPYSVD